MNYYDELEILIKKFSESSPLSIQISTEDFLSDEPIPLSRVDGICQEILDTQFVKDKKGNYYWPTLTIDILIHLGGKKHFFFTVQDRKAAILNQKYSQAIDLDILKRAREDNDKELESIILKDLLEYNEEPVSDHSKVIVEDKFMIKNVVIDATKQVISYWSKKFPELSNLPIDFIIER